MAKERQFKKRFLLLVEGQSEKFYFNELKRNHSNLEISFTCLDVHGGGYHKFLQELNKYTGKGFLAIAIILDLDKEAGVDDSIARQENQKQLQRLVNECNRRNRQKDQCILIFGSFLNIEYFFASHCNNFKANIPADQFLKKEFGYKSAKDIKRDEKIYNKLNSNTNTFHNIDDSKPTFFMNQSIINFKRFKFTNIIKINYEMSGKYNTNCKQLIDILTTH